jgi:hypothetical protein
MRFRVPVSSCGAAAWIALACAGSPPAPAPTPPAKAAAAAPVHEKTAADPALQRDVTHLIDECEKKLGSAGRVVDTRFELLQEDKTVVESWIVSRDALEVVYLVKLTPTPDGTEIAVQCPPKPRVK